MTMNTIMYSTKKRLFCIMMMCVSFNSYNLNTYYCCLLLLLFLFIFHILLLLFIMMFFFLVYYYYYYLRSYIASGYCMHCDTPHLHEGSQIYHQWSHLRLPGTSYSTKWQAFRSQKTMQITKMMPKKPCQLSMQMQAPGKVNLHPPMDPHPQAAMMKMK